MTVSGSSNILESVLERLEAHGNPTLATVDRITVGDAAILVELEDVPTATGDGVTTAGLAHRPRGPLPPQETVETMLEWAVDASPNHANDISGIDAATAVRRATGIAAVNALSAPFVRWHHGDPMEALASSVETIATVGLFRPAFSKFGDVSVNVIERERVGPVADLPETASMYTPADAASAFSGADVVFITGSTLVYGGIDRYLSLLESDQTVVLIGATASFLPEPVFDAGVDVLAGATITNRTRVREAIERGDCGTDLHDAGVTKGFVTRTTTEALVLPEQTADSNSTHETIERS